MKELLQVLIIAIIMLVNPCIINIDQHIVTAGATEKTIYVAAESETYIATAYCSGLKTSTGSKPVVGRTIAVDPTVIKYGTEVKITCDEYPAVNGIYKAEDCGGDIKGKRIDIYMHNVNRSMDFGVRKVEVTINGQY